MNSESQTKEYKSLQKIRTGDKGFKDLSTTCVALANAQGGQIYVGYDDKRKQAPPNQTVDVEEINTAVTKLRSLCFNVGYDLIYELNSLEAKEKPIIESSYNECVVTQYAKILKPEILPLLDYVMKYYQLRQKDFTAFGIIAREQKIYATELSQELQLPSDERLRSYVNFLVKQGLVLQKGVNKGSYYVVNPLLINNAKTDKIPTTLKTIDSDVLVSLILQDLEKHPWSKLSEIASRLPDADIKEVRKLVYALVGNKIKTEGAKTNRRYSLL